MQATTSRALTALSAELSALRREMTGWLGRLAFLFMTLAGGAVASDDPVTARSDRAAPEAIAGSWVSRDDEGSAKARIRIVVEGARALGRIEEVLASGAEKKDATCDRCPGELRGRPYKGLPILHVTRDAASGHWRGTVLDPEEGETYRCEVSVADGGRRLVVRGYVAWPVFGRSVAWTRAP